MAPTRGDTNGSRIRGRLRRPRNRLLVGAVFLGAVGAFVWYRLDWRRVVSAVVGADPLMLAVGVVAATAGLVCWSESMRHLLPPGSAAVSRRRSFLVYATGSLVRRVMPLGYAGSMGVLAVLFGREVSLPFDRSLASVSAAEFVNMIVSTALAVLGVLLLVLFGPPSPYVRWLAIGALGVVVGGGIAGTLLVYRAELIGRSAGATASRLAAVARRLPGLRSGRVPTEPIERGVERYVSALSTISSRRRAVAVSVGYSLLAWSALVAALYASGLAVGYRVPIAVALIVVPVGGYASILPVPGGLGGYELGVAGAIALLGGIDVATALAATLLFRVCTYWFVIGVGLVTSAALSIDVRTLARAAVERGQDESGVDSGSAEP